MEPAAATTAMSPRAWRGMVKRRSQAWEERERAHRRLEELEVEVIRLRAEKKAAERAAAALTAELEAEQGAAETAATEAMMMIGRLQREKSAAMIEAREFRRVAEIRAARERELHDRLAEACALAASYQALLRAHGVNPDGSIDKAKGAVIEEAASSSSSSPLAAKELFEDKYAVDVRWKKPVAGERVVTGDDLRARVEALEADSAAVRREVAALRVENAQQAVPAWRRRMDDDAAGKQQHFSVLTVFKWFFSPLSWAVKRSASAARMLPRISSSPATYFLLGLLPLLGGPKGTLHIQRKTSHEPVTSFGQEYFMLSYFFQ